MAADPALTAQLDELVSLFNRRSMDLPDGLFDRRTQFVLNGAPFETLLGQSPSDPLILMLSRGPAGYRFVVKAIQHAVPDARLERGELAEYAVATQRIFRADCWLSGRLRGTGEPEELVFGVELVVTPAGALERAAVTLDPVALSRLREARLKP
jgi:hypothetical protein